MKNDIFGSKISRFKVFQSILFVSFLMFGFVGFKSGSNVRAEELINPHDFTKKKLCAQCHIEGSPDLRYDEITVCFRCHSENLADHVIDVKPKKALVPAGWYMSSDNKMVCYSCHDYHHKSVIGRVLWVEYDRLCVLCHVGY